VQPTEPEYTTVQLLTVQREEIEQLQRQTQAIENRTILLREMTTRVVAAGLKALAPTIAPNGAFVEEA